MIIGKLVDLLDRAGFDSDPEALLDALWLATQLGERSAGSLRRNGRTSDFRSEAAVLGDVTAQPSLPHARPVPIEPARTPAPIPGETEQPIYPNTASSGDAVHRASPVRVAGAPSSIDRLALSRALRPFRIPWTRGGQTVLDEEATVETIARAELSGHGMVAPVLRPLAERWFSVDLVLEDDRAMDVWRDEARAIASALRTTGAFGRLRKWRLEHGEDGTPLLRSEGGATIPASSIGGERQLVLFLTHGVSAAWASGRLDSALRKWAHHGSVALIQMLPTEWWPRTTLGEADARVALDDPGAPSAAGRIAPAWWIDELAPDAIAIPILPLESRALGAWARMVMARGAAVPSHLLTQTREEMPHEYIDDDVIARRLAMLRETEPRAFELAVVLNALSFTIPVARVVQEAHLGTRDSRPLAALLLSGLIAPMEQAEGAAGNWFALHPLARRHLRGSLRRSDARKISEALVSRVSEHIAKATGRVPDMTSFSPNAAGVFDLPRWAEPYARLAQGLRTPVYQEGPSLRAIERLREQLQRHILGKLMRDVVMDRPLSLDDDPDLWDSLLSQGLTELLPSGDRRLVAAARDVLAAWHRDNPLWGLRILWVDDIPANNADYVPLLRNAGADVIEVETTRAALAAPLDRFDMIISDMARREGGEEGLRLLSRLRRRHGTPPVIIFSSRYPRSRLRRLEALRAGALAVTNDFGTINALLLDYALDPDTAWRRGRELASAPGENDEDREWSGRRRDRRDDWGLVVNLDGENARRSGAGSWIFALALRNLFGVDPERIERSTQRGLYALNEMLDQQILSSTRRFASTGYIYLCGGHDRPLRRDMLRQLEMLLMRVSDRPQSLQIVLVADFGSAVQDQTGFRRDFDEALRGRYLGDAAEVLLVSVASADDQDPWEPEGHEALFDRASSAIPAFTRHVLGLVEGFGGPDGAMVGGTLLQKAIETYSDQTTAELWTRISSDAELAIESTDRESLLRPWDHWHREGVNLAALGDDANALVAVSAARVVAPATLDPEIAAEMVIIEAALNRRLGFDREAGLLLERTQKIWDTSRFRNDGRFHQAAIAMALDRTAEAVDLLRSTRFAQEVVLAVRRHPVLFGPLEAAAGYSADTERALARGQWDRVAETGFTLDIRHDDPTEAARVHLQTMADRYFREAAFGREVRIRMDCDGEALSRTDVPRYDDIRAILQQVAEGLGIDRDGWEDRSTHPPRRADGPATDHIRVMLSVERGPRRIFE